jgi:signal transduction histidine kinase
LPAYFLAVAVWLTLMNFFFVLQITDEGFHEFIFASDSARARLYAGLLAEYYEENEGWTGVQEFVVELPKTITANLGTHMFDTEESQEFNPYLQPIFDNLFSERVAVANNQGVIVADSACKLVGQIHPQEYISDGIPIETATGCQGTVLLGSLIDSSLADHDRAYLEAVKRSLVFPFLFSVLVAIGLGLLLSRRITKPVEDLSRGAKEIIESHRFDPVPVRGNDELTELAVIFNEMVTELNDLDKAKKQIIADAAHELRTPVTLIQGTVEGMLDGILPLDSTNLQSVLEEVLRLSLLIDMLRELKIIDAGELNLHLEPVDIRTLVSKSLSLFTPVANEKQLSVSFVHLRGEDPFVSGDFLRLREVVDNLLVNAIKYTPNGGRIRISEKESPDGFVMLCVEDSGPGIEIAERERVFERFYRIDKSRSPESGGRGLGLAISAEIIQAHGGTVSIGTSDLGGASFCINLPRGKNIPAR